jgi:hypothetical protein
MAVRISGHWKKWLKFFLRGVIEVRTTAARTARQIRALRESSRQTVLLNLPFAGSVKFHPWAMQFLARGPTAVVLPSKYSSCRKIVLKYPAVTGFSNDTNTSGGVRRFLWITGVVQAAQKCSAVG